jgi:PAS domain S-box-containing protein
MSGIEFCKELISNEISLPIIILVGTDGNGLATEALKIGVDDYLIKDPDQGYLDQLPIILFDAVRKHTHRLASKYPDDGYIVSMTRYPIIIEDQNELIRCFSLDGTLTYVNSAYYRYFNETPDQLMGRSFLHYAPEEEHERIKEHIVSLSPQNPVKIIEHPVQGLDEEKRWLEWTDRAILNGHGNITGYQSIGRDVSRIKHALETLFQSQERYRSVMDIIPDGFFVCDIVSGDFLLINQQACDVFGYPMQEMLTLSLWDVVGSDNLEKLKDQIRTQVHEDIARLPNETYTMQHQNGKNIHVELSSSLTVIDGKRVLHGIIREKK